MARVLWTWAPGWNASDEIGDREGEVLSDPGDERDLLLRVAPGLGLAEAAEALHDAIERVGLEGEDPLPVAQAERARRVREHIRVLPAHDTVLPEELSTLLGREQVPVDRPH